HARPARCVPAASGGGRQAGGLEADRARPARRGRRVRGCGRGRVRALIHQGTGPASSKNPPVGPSSGSVASWIAIAAPWLGVRKPWKPLRSVAVKPGQTELIRILVPLSSLAYWKVMALRKVLDAR